MSKPENIWRPENWDNDLRKERRKILFTLALMLVGTMGLFYTIMTDPLYAPNINSTDVLESLRRQLSENPELSSFVVASERSGGFVVSIPLLISIAILILGTILAARRVKRFPFLNTFTILICASILIITGNTGGTSQVSLENRFAQSLNGYIEDYEDDTAKLVVGLQHFEFNSEYKDSVDGKPASIEVLPDEELLVYIKTNLD